MLTYDALIEHAKQRGMPAVKLRGILREYLQIIILKELCGSAQGRKLYFTGGTYLRFVHGLKRFSEDLDFNTDSIDKKEFEDSINEVRLGLARRNIESKFKFGHWKNIYSADIVFPEIEKKYGVESKFSKKQGIVIKIETNRPQWEIRKETGVISGFGEVYPCICTDKAALFADKIDALNKKAKARHIYDLIFMLSNQHPIDKKVLSILGIKGSPEDVILKRINSFSKTDLKKQAEGLRPFLFEEKDADLILSAHTIFPALLEKYNPDESL